MEPKRAATHLVTAAQAARKPLLGFGWRGAAFVPVLVALVLVVATGYDLRYQMQRGMLGAFGLQALFDFTTYAICGSGMGAGSWPPAPRFGPVALCIVAVALHVHPRRVGRGRMLGVWLVGLFGPGVTLWLVWKPLKALTPGGPAWEIGITAWWLFAAAALWSAARSWRIGLMSAVCLGVPVALAWLVRYDSAGFIPPPLGREVQYEFGPLGVAVHVALAAIFFAWAIRARRSVLPAYACPQCGYDLRGVVAPACPECGAGRGGLETESAPLAHARGSS